MIQKGDSPEGVYNKFLIHDSDGYTEGHRGELLAVSTDLKMGIIKGRTGFTTGKLYHVQETDPEAYPRATGEVYQIPDDYGPPPPRLES